MRSGSSAERLAGSLSPTSSNERLAGTGDQRSSNSKLSEAGREYGVDLGRYLKVNYQMSGRSRPKSSPLNEDLGSELMVLTGTSSVHTETVSHLRMLFRCYNTPLLNELRGGDLQGMVRQTSRLETYLSCLSCLSCLFCLSCLSLFVLFVLSHNKYSTSHPSCPAYLIYFLFMRTCLILTYIFVSIILSLMLLETL